ncbi:MAG: AAA family ATPase, partial [Longimicrobiales bacterium]|nr:AAA family ATPase [Longimicrobiales bacterium]
MRIEHIRVDGFGRLSDFDTGARALGRLVVVLGPNEAGKSTLFSFLTTALYGFQPASRELSPFVPWGSDEAGGEIVIRLTDGRCATVSRRLRSSPSGKVELEDSGRDLRNRPVPWVEHVPRTVFRQVFAITLAELAGLDEETWGRIQDRVLGSMGASDVRSARDVAEALEKEAGEIWRPNRRGNQRLRDLQEDVRELRSRRKEAMARDRRIRELVEERENVRLRLTDVREDRHRDKLAIEHVQELLPLKRQLERIAELRRVGGARAPLDDLPPDPASEREALLRRRDALSSEQAAVVEELRAPEAAVARFDDERRRILEHRDALAAFVSRARQAGSEADRGDELSVELKDLRIRRRTSAEQLLVEPESRTARDAVAGVSVDLLRDRISRYEAAARAERATAAAAPGGTRVGGVPALTLLGTGAAFLAWGISRGSAAVTAAGAAGLAVGLALLLGVGRERRDAGTAKESAADALLREIREMLDDVPIRPEYLEPPGPSLASELERLQELVLRCRQLETALEAHERSVAEARSEAQRLCELVAWSDPPPLAELAHALDRALAEAERARSGAEVAERERHRLLRRREEISEALDAVEGELRGLEARILAAAEADGEGGGSEGPAGGVERPASGTADLEELLPRVQQRIDAHARADRLEEELERSHPDLEEKRERIETAEEEGRSWTVDEEDLARRKLRVEELERTIEELIQRAEALERDVAHLRKQETTDVVDGEIQSLEAEQERLTRERDRKWLLATLIRQADRRFREEHQPDLLRRASEYLARLTGGRYERLLVDEESHGDLFQLVGPGLPAPVPLAR